MPKDQGTQAARTTSEAVTRPFRVAIIEDERELREGLSTLINFTSQFVCNEKCGSVEVGLARINDKNTDLILTDLGLPQMNGIEGIKIFRSRFPGLPILVLTVQDENDKIFEALCAGANGYLLKNTPPDKIIEALSQVIDGGAPMSPEVARHVVHLFRKFAPPLMSDYSLTKQEAAILKLLVEGHHYKTAAHHLDISVHTVSFHLRNIYSKLHVHSKTEAVAKAIREGIV